MQWWINQHSYTQQKGFSMPTENEILTGWSFSIIQKEGYCKLNMKVRKVKIERLSVISSKRFEEVLATLEAAIGHPDMVEFTKDTDAAHTFAEFESVVHKRLGSTGLMMFMKLDHGAVVRKETGLNTPKICVM